MQQYVCADMQYVLLYFYLPSPTMSNMTNDFSHKSQVLLYALINECGMLLRGGSTQVVQVQKKNVYLHFSHTFSPSSYNNIQQKQGAYSMFHDKIEWMMILQHNTVSQHKLKSAMKKKITLMAVQSSHILPQLAQDLKRIRRKEHKRPCLQQRTQKTFVLSTVIHDDWRNAATLQK